MAPAGTGNLGTGVLPRLSSHAAAAAIAAAHPSSSDGTLEVCSSWVQSHSLASRVTGFSVEHPEAAFEWTCAHALDRCHGAGDEGIANDDCPGATDHYVAMGAEAIDRCCVFPVYEHCRREVSGQLSSAC